MTVGVVFQSLIEGLREETLEPEALYPPGSAGKYLLKRATRLPGTGAVDLETLSEFIAAHRAT